MVENENAWKTQIINSEGKVTGKRWALNIKNFRNSLRTCFVYISSLSYAQNDM